LVIFLFPRRERLKSGKKARTARIARLLVAAGCAAPLLSALTGCEHDSFIDPSVTGRWEVTPTTVPILERLVAIEGPAGQASVETTPVRPEDLIPEVEQYRLGAGDAIEVRIQDLFRADSEEVFPREVDSRGFIDLPKIGRVVVDGLTEDQVREQIIETLLRMQILTREPVVTVSVARPRRLTYNILGGVASPGLYGINRPDFRLLDALSGAGRFAESVPNIYVIRYIPLNDKVIRGSGPRPAGQPAPARPGDVQPSAPVTPSTPPPEDLIDLIDSLSKPKDKPADQPGGNPAIMPAVMAGAMGQPPEPQPPKEPPVDLPDETDSTKPASPLVKPQTGAAPRTDQTSAATGNGPTGAKPADTQPDRFWVFRDGKWIQVTRIRRGNEPPAGSAQPGGPAVTQDGRPVQAQGPAQPPSVPGAEKLVTQRVIEVPMAPLLAGSAQFNIIIRPGDIIRVPSSPEGVVYIGGEVNRPGVFALPASGRLTVTRAMVASGNLSNIGIPERMDLTRMVGTDRQATIRLNYRAIQEGTMPDIFLKADDVINVGTNFWAYPLAVIRSGLRASYGFGFILDRNFDEEVFGPRQGVR
jgi:polysaccharide export outer membrane protein